MAKLWSRGAHIRYCCIAMVFLGGKLASAHVELDSPQGGESISGGFVFPIDWHVAIPHNTLDWDLWYSTTSATGPWIEIATDLPKGDITEGAPHSFDWQVPNSNMAAAWVRVRQDNGGQDYYDVSSNSFSISAAAMGDFTGNGVVNNFDMNIWEDGFGASAGAFFTDGDDDSDGDVDGLDFLRWQSNHLAGANPLAIAQIVPEPSSLLLLIVGTAIALFRRR